MQRTTLRVLLLVAALASALAFPAAAQAGWVPVGGKLNDPAAGAGQPNGAFAYGVDMAHLGGQGIWAAWINEPFSGGDTPQTRVARFTGGSWLRPGGTAAGANPMVATTSRAESIDIANVGGVPWVAWTERAGGAAPQLFVKRWNGSAWVDADGAGSPPSLNVDGAVSARDPQITNVGGSPCVTWWELPLSGGAAGNVYVKCLVNSSTWVQRGGRLNTTATTNATNPSIAAIPHPSLPGVDVLHVAWTEVDASEMSHVPGEEAGGTIRVARFEFPSSWVSVGGGIRADPANYANRPDLTAIEGVPYLAWQEKDRTQGPDAFIAPTLVFVTSFNGTSWSAGSLASDFTRDAGAPHIAGIGGVPHVAYSEADNQGFNPSFQRSVRVRKVVPGSGWQPVEGNTPIRKEDHESVAPGELIDVNGMPYLAFGGNNGLWVDRWLITLVNTDRPFASGTPAVGDTLTCNPGTWTTEPDTGTVLYQYNWEQAPRDASDEDDQAWSFIQDAFTQQYTVREGDANLRVRCRVRAQNSHDTVEVTSPSVRTDVGTPFNVAAPTIDGTSITGNEHICVPGEWSTEVSFSYRWRIGGSLIPGATDRTYTPPRLRFGAEPVPDSDHRLTCEVTASNDVGPAPPAVSADVYLVDAPPASWLPPQLTGEVPDANPVGREVTCQPGVWTDDYVRLGIGDYRYEYQWLRNGEPIAGEIAGTYTTKVEDLGTELSCRVWSSNTAGRGQPADSVNRRIPLPAVTSAGTMYTAIGKNEYVPINMMAIGREYKRVVDEYALRKLSTARGAEFARCRSAMTADQLAAGGRELDALKIGEPVSDAARCAAIVLRGHQVNTYAEGIEYMEKCRGVRSAFIGGPVVTECLDLGFALPPVDPSKPPPLDLPDQARLAAVTPVQTLWDVDDDGLTDVTCPGSAPVMRTMLKRGNWNPRAIIVYPDSATTGVFSEARQPGTMTNPPNTSGPRGELRDAQPLMCRTSIEQPPDPEVGPCVTDGTIGRVRLTGNLCPISIRTMTQEQIEEIRLNNSELLPVLEGFAAGAENDEVNGGTPREPDSVVRPEVRPVLPPGSRVPGLRPRVVYADIGAPSGLRPRGFSVRGTEQAAAFANTSSAAPAFRVTGTLEPRLEQFEADPVPPRPGAFRHLRGKEKANFTLDQMYISEGAMKVNGITVDPAAGARGRAAQIGNLPGLIIPTDVNAGIAKPDNVPKSVPSMKVLVKQAKTAMGNFVTSEGKRIEAEFKDSAEAEFRKDADKFKEDAKDGLNGLLQSDIVDAAKAFKIGPFKLLGEVHVQMNKDQTATLYAKAELPLISLSPNGSAIQADVVLSGDREGNIKLQSIEITAKKGYFGAIDLKDLFMRYDPGGLTIRGKVVFAFPPANPSIEIHNFHMTNEPKVDALDIEFESAVGVAVGPGIFLVGLRAGYDDPNKKITGGATFSAGPAAAGCPPVGLKGVLSVQWKDLVRFTSDSNLTVACIPLVKVKLNADSSGYVGVAAGVDVNLGPIFYKAVVGGQFKGCGRPAPGQIGCGFPDFQLEYDGRGGIRDIPLIGTVSIGLRAILSNNGFAVCGSVEVLWEEIGVGAGIYFPNGQLPDSLGALIDTIKLFTGCDLSAWRVMPSIVGMPRAHAAQSAQAAQAARTIEVPRAPRGMGLMFHGAGGPPKLVLRSPTGKVYDFTDSTDGKLVDDAYGVLVEAEGKTVVLFRNPQPGRWTVEPAPGSPEIVRIEQSNVLPKAEVKGKVGGIGSSRILKYEIPKIAGQSVRLLEQANGAHHLLRTVKGGGKGTIRFRTAEADSNRRKIVAEVTQDGLPRANIDVASFTAPNPKVGPARRVRVRRRGRTAVVTWRKAQLAQRYDVVVRAGDGGRSLLAPRGRRTRVSVPGVAKNEGLVVKVIAISPRGRRARAAQARLKVERKKSRRPARKRGRAKRRG